MQDLPPNNQDDTFAQPTRIHRLKTWAKRIKADIQALASAARDPRVPWTAKLVVAFVLAYALSPIDLIPDFIPIIGYLDDLIILPLGIALAVRLIPVDVLAEHRARVTNRKPTNHKSTAGAAIVIALWLAAAALLIWWFI